MAVLALWMTWTLPVSAAPETYRLGPLDTVALRVGLWDATAGAFNEWAGVGGEYTVGPDGRLSVLIAGSITAAGKSLEELEKDIAYAMQRQIGLAEPPSIAIEITTFRPIFVSGAVAAPGGYGYQFGMTVQQAVALAGGAPRALGAGANTSLQLIRLQSEISRFDARITELENEERRLLQELEKYGDTGVDPDALSAPLSEIESKLMASNEVAIASQRDGLQALQTLLRQQVASLTEELELIDRQIALAREELEAVSSLKDRGLTVNTRVTSLTGTLNNLEAKRLQTEVARLTAEQELNTAQREEAGILDQARLTRLRELKATGRDLREARNQLEAARALYAEQGALSAAEAEALDLPQPIYRVTRFGPDGPQMLDLAPTDTLMPGDTLEVIQPAFSFSSN